MDMENFDTVDHTTSEIPHGYKCFKCGATGCKLWRNYQMFLEHQDLVCAKCAAEEQKEDISTLDEKGFRKTDHGRTDQIGNRIPAVPTVEGDTFWGYTSVPPDGCKWWINLPSLPK